jgi:hypothetical protein
MDLRMAVEAGDINLYDSYLGTVGALRPGLRIRIGSGAGSGSRRAKITHKSGEKFKSSCFEVLNGLF